MTHASSPKRLILLKLTGDILAEQQNQAVELVTQIKQLSATHQFAIVIGGGNFWRGNQQGQQFKIKAAVAHQVGLLATVMNALILQEIFWQHNLPTTVLSAVDCPRIAAPVSNNNIRTALNQAHCLIFAGGTGEPFFSTDTAAVVRALQINAHEIWKATNVAGIFTADPRLDPQAKLLKQVSYQMALAQNLQVMDQTAFILASAHQLPIRVFDLFAPAALVQAAQNSDFGSLLS